MNNDQIDLAHGYALGILDADEQWEVGRLRSGPDSQDFDTLVRQTRATLTAISAATIVTPPARLRDRLLSTIDRDTDRFGTDGFYAGETVQFEPIDPQHVDQQRTDQRFDVRRPDESGFAERRSYDEPASLSRHRERKQASRWKLAAGSVAAAVVLLAGGIAIGNQFGGSSPSTAEQIIAASDVRAANYPVATGGTATAIFSQSEDAAVLLMNNVAAPQSGSVYQMWFVEGENAPVSAGIMTDSAAPTVVEGLGNATTLAVTLEPTGGSQQPTTSPFVALTLT